MRLMFSRKALLMSVALVTPALPALAQDQKVNEEDPQLAPIVVEAESDDTLLQDGYVAVESQIGTKTDQSVIEMPQSTSVITEKQLDDRAPRTLQEALNYTPSVNTTTYGYDSRYDAYFLRGFPGVYNGMFRDGLRQSGGSSAVYRTEPYGIEGIELLKGSNSTLYGPSSSGGFANMVTKRPTKKPFHEIELLGGSHDRLQGSIDYSDRLFDDDSVLYRFTGLYRDADTQLRGYKDDRMYLAPSVTFNPTDDTKLTLLAEYMDSVTGGTATFVNVHNNVTDIYAGLEDFNEFRHEQYRLGYEFEHRINDTFTIRQNARFHDVAIDLQYGRIDSSLNRSAGRAVEGQDNFVIDTHLQSEFETGEIYHTLVSGVDFSTTRYDQHQGFAAIPDPGDTISLNSIYDTKQEQFSKGVYAQDQMAYGDWRFILGARYDWLDSTTKKPTSTTHQDDAEFTYRGGVSYVTNFGLVPYVSYSTSFTPNVGTLVDDSPAKPTIGKTIEAGVKYEIPERNAVVTASVFNIDQEDGVVFDASSGVNKQVQQDMRSRGFEVEVQASLMEGLNVSGGYAYTDVEIIDGATGTNGKQLSGSPEHIASLFANYTFQRGSLKGFGFGGGTRYAGESYGNDTNSFENDGRIYFDAMMQYDLSGLSEKLEGVSAKINATNIFDQRYTACSAGFCYKDEGRMVYGSVRYRF